MKKRFKTILVLSLFLLTSTSIDRGSAIINNYTSDDNSFAIKLASGHWIDIDLIENPKANRFQIEDEDTQLDSAVFTPYKSFPQNVVYSDYYYADSQTVTYSYRLPADYAQTLNPKECAGVPWQKTGTSDIETPTDITQQVWNIPLNQIDNLNKTPISNAFSSLPSSVFKYGDISLDFSSNPPLVTSHIRSGLDIVCNTQTKQIELYNLWTLDRWVSPPENTLHIDPGPNLPPKDTIVASTEPETQSTSGIKVISKAKKSPSSSSSKAKTSLQKSKPSSKKKLAPKKVIPKPKTQSK
jgi:hypothetical protein